MSQKDADYIQYQYNQLYEAQLEAGELEELELEQRRLANAEDILSYLKETQQELNGDENSNGAIMGVRGAQHALQHISEFLHPDENLLERLESAYIELKDIANSIESQLDETDADPEQLQITEERIGLIHGLLRKYDVETEDELIALRDKLEQQIGRCDSYDFEIEQLEKRLSERLKTLKQAAKTLTASRKAVEPMLKQKMESMLTQLGIAHAQIGLRLTPLPDFSETGQDDVTILFAANLGQTPRPVSDIASGGEMARIMLSIKALVADKKGLPTIIFDEVDTGLSGEVASHMGGIMSEIAHERQVLSITHLPQIAALGNHHYKVYKQDTDVRTETHIRRLAENERAEEIAMLLSDTHITPEAIENAKRLLKKRNENEVP
ncbi:MAG: hypothetical protein MJZ89_06175 [Paludibacteraceae bacterium]|nr:hypothetical protein [Paludibacteraceae bacterium]